MTNQLDLNLYNSKFPTKNRFQVLKHCSNISYNNIVNHADLTNTTPLSLSIHEKFLPLDHKIENIIEKKKNNKKEANFEIFKCKLEQITGKRSLFKKQNSLINVGIRDIYSNRNVYYDNTNNNNSLTNSYDSVSNNLLEDNLPKSLNKIDNCNPTNVSKISRRRSRSETSFLEYMGNEGQLYEKVLRENPKYNITSTKQNKNANIDKMGFYNNRNMQNINNEISVNRNNNDSFEFNCCENNYENQDYNNNYAVKKSSKNTIEKIDDRKDFESTQNKNKIFSDKGNISNDCVKNKANMNQVNLTENLKTLNNFTNVNTDNNIYNKVVNNFEGNEFESDQISNDVFSERNYNTYNSQDKTMLLIKKALNSLKHQMNFQNMQSLPNLNAPYLNYNNDHFNPNPKILKNLENKKAEVFFEACMKPDLNSASSEISKICSYNRSVINNNHNNHNNNNNNNNVHNNNTNYNNSKNSFIPTIEDITSNSNNSNKSNLANLSNDYKCFLENNHKNKEGYLNNCENKNGDALMDIINELNLIRESNLLNDTNNSFLLPILHSNKKELHYNSNLKNSKLIYNENNNQGHAFNFSNYANSEQSNSLNKNSQLFANETCGEMQNSPYVYMNNENQSQSRFNCLNKFEEKINYKTSQNNVCNLFEQILTNLNNSNLILTKNAEKDAQRSINSQSNFNDYSRSLSNVILNNDNRIKSRLNNSCVSKNVSTITSVSNNNNNISNKSNNSLVNNNTLLIDSNAKDSLINCFNNIISSALLLNEINKDLKISTGNDFHYNNKITSDILHQPISICLAEISNLIRLLVLDLQILALFQRQQHEIRSLVLKHELEWLQLSEENGVDTVAKFRNSYKNINN